jgi:hypothetical protein
MSSNYSQPPYSPEGARRRSKEPPKPSKGTHKAGTSSCSFGTGGAAKITRKGAFKPGLRAGPKRGRD